MAFDGITVAALTKEFNDKLTGGYIQKIASRKLMSCSLL